MPPKSKWMTKWEEKRKFLSNLLISFVRKRKKERKPFVRWKKPAGFVWQTDSLYSDYQLFLIIIMSSPSSNWVQRVERNCLKKEKIKRKRNNSDNSFKGSLIRKKSMDRKCKTYVIHKRSIRGKVPKTENMIFQQRG